MDFLRGYLIAINLLTFSIRGMDKWKAVKGKRRINENTLLILSLLGGRGGGYLAMSCFRHKTLKGSFLWKFWLIVVVWILFIIRVLQRQ